MAKYRVLRARLSFQHLSPRLIERVLLLVCFQMGIRCKVTVHACDYFVILRLLILIFLSKVLTGVVKVAARVYGFVHIFSHSLTFLDRQLWLGYILRTFRGGSYFSPFLVILIIRSFSFFLPQLFFLNEGDCLFVPGRFQF